MTGFVELESDSLSLQEIAAIKKHAVSGREYSDRVSFQLAVRLLGLLGSLPDTFAILDEMDFLEGIRPVSRTKPASQFTKPPLFPLWHKHFHTARHIKKNCAIRYGFDGNGQGNRDFHAMVNDVAHEYGGLPELWQKQLAHRMTVGAYEDRVSWKNNSPDGNLTGDWIIFCKHEGKIFFLDIATHKEGDDPEKLLEKLSNGCAFEFPFAFQFESDSQ